MYGDYIRVTTGDGEVDQAAIMSQLAEQARSQGFTTVTIWHGAPPPEWPAPLPEPTPGTEFWGWCTD